MALPRLHRTARQSPALATMSWSPQMKAVRAVVPEQTGEVSLIGAWNALYSSRSVRINACTCSTSVASASAFAAVSCAGVHPTEATTPMSVSMSYHGFMHFSWKQTVCL